MKRERAFYGWSPVGGWVVYIVQVLLIVASALWLRKLLGDELQKVLRGQMRELVKIKKGKGKGKGREGGGEGEEGNGGEGAGEGGRGGEGDIEQQRNLRVLPHYDQSLNTTDTTNTTINTPIDTRTNSPLTTRPNTPANTSTTASSGYGRLEYLVWEGIETITAGPALHMDPRGGRLPDPGFTHAIARRNMAWRSARSSPYPSPNPHRSANGHANGYGNGNGNWNSNGEGSSRGVQRRRDGFIAADAQGFPFPPMPPSHASLPPRCQSRAGRRGENGVYIPLSGGPGAWERARELGAWEGLQGRRRPPMLRQLAPIPMTGFSVPIARSNSTGNGNGNGNVNGKGKAPTFTPAQPSPLRFGVGFQAVARTGGSSEPIKPHPSEPPRLQGQTQGEYEGESQGQGQGQGEDGAQGTSAPSANPQPPTKDPENGARAKAAVNVNGSCRLDRLKPRKLQNEDVVFELATFVKSDTEPNPQPAPNSESKTEETETELEVTANAKAGAKTSGQDMPVPSLSRATTVVDLTKSEAVAMGMPPLERCPKRARTLSSPDSGVALDEMV